MERNKEIDRYIANAPAEYIPLLNEVRQNIFEIVGNEPEMSENYSYQIAVYKYGQKPIFSLAYFKDHCSFITQDKEIQTKIPELKGFKVSGTSIHFTLENPLTKDLLEKIIRLRLEERKNN